jgi:hypothetical protein
MPGAALVLALALAHAQPAALQPARGMTIATPPSIEVMIARKVDDGTLETACVDNDDAAKAFFAGAKSKKVVYRLEEK